MESESNTLASLYHFIDYYVEKTGPNEVLRKLYSDVQLLLSNKIISISETYFSSFESFG